MNTLVIKQTLKNGSIKSWKIRSNQEPQTFGSSRLAKLISISPNSPGIEGVFEFKNNHWWFHYMSIQSTQISSQTSIEINQSTQIQLFDSTLQVTPFIKEENLFNQVEAFKSMSEKGPASTYQIYIAKIQDKIMDVKVLPIGQNYKYAKYSPSEEWQYSNFEHFKVQQKTISMQDLSQYAHLTQKQLLDDESKKGAYVVILAAFLIVAAGLMGPRKTSEMTLMELPKVAQKIIVKTDIKPKKIQPVEKPAQTAKPVAVQPPPASAPKTADVPTTQTKGGKVANMLKSISGGRISQLIGKVSSQAAKSANVVISNGVKAGQAGSGRALAALGSVEKSGRDWGKESSGKEVMVSTAGRGGGKNASGMGGLAAGKTGNAGVGLIEEESEITGGLDREVIAQYIKTQLGQILYCYERQLSANPELFGKVAVRFTIGPMGSVEQQIIGDSTLKNATVEGCILNRVAAWRFPAPAGGTKVLVTYPFLFKSTN